MSFCVELFFVEVIRGFFSQHSNSLERNDNVITLASVLYESFTFYLTFERKINVYNEIFAHARVYHLKFIYRSSIFFSIVRATIHLIIIPVEFSIFLFVPRATMAYSTHRIFFFVKNYYIPLKLMIRLFAHLQN